MPDTTDPYDVVILGGGSGGYACALRSAELGLSVALVEKDKLGGTCLHRGCIPTKALLHAAEIADAAQHGKEFGVISLLQGIDIAGVNSYKDGVTAKLHRGLQGLIAAQGITYISGHGVLASPTSVRVGEQEIHGRHIVLATGSAPRSLPGLDLDGSQVLTSDDALRLGRIPSSAIILGGGVIGVEFASIWKSFGVDVSIVEALPRLLPLEDESSSQLLQRAYRRRGIRFELGQRFTGLTRSAEGVTITLDSGLTLSAELLLVAVGRGPVSEGIGLAEAGIQTERGYVVADELCRTSVVTVSAVGDLIATPQLAHVGFAEGILVAERMAGLPVEPINYPYVPRIAYCEPEVASVGLTSAQAADAGFEVVESVYDLGGNGKSQILRTSGSVKLVAAKDGPVLGVHIVGSRAGELIAEAQLITNWEATADEVARLIHPHPTMSEAIGEAHLLLAGKPLHAHA